MRTERTRSGNPRLRREPSKAELRRGSREKREPVLHQITGKAVVIWPHGGDSIFNNGGSFCNNLIRGAMDTAMKPFIPLPPQIVDHCLPSKDGIRLEIPS